MVVYWIVEFGKGITELAACVRIIDWLDHLMHTSPQTVWLGSNKSMVKYSIVGCSKDITELAASVRFIDWLGRLMHTSPKTVVVFEVWFLLL